MSYLQNRLVENLQLRVTIIMSSSIIATNPILKIID